MNGAFHKETTSIYFGREEKSGNSGSICCSENAFSIGRAVVK